MNCKEVELKAIYALKTFIVVFKVWFLNIYWELLTTLTGNIVNWQCAGYYYINMNESYGAVHYSAYNIACFKINDSYGAEH